MKHRVSRWALAVVAAGALAMTTGCAGPSKSPQTGGSSRGSQGPVTVRFWQNQFSNEDNAWFKATVDEFNKSQDKVNVVLTVVPGDAWEQKLKAAQAAGQAPDMYTMNYSAVPMNARNGQLAPITDYIDAAAWDDLDPRFRAAVTVDDKQYAYPIYYEPSALLFYRTDLYQAAGLDPKNPPTTYAELVAAGEELKAADSTTVPFQIAQTAVELSWSTWGAQYGTSGHMPIADDWSTAQADDAAYKPLFQLYQDLYSKGILAKQPLSAYGDATPLGQGKLASMASGSWAISLLLADFPKMVDKLAVAPMPSVDGDPSRTTATLGGWTIGVDAKSEHVQQAASAISWMLAEDASFPKAYFTATKFTKLSPRMSLADELAQDPERSVDPFYDVLVESTKTAILEPTYDWQVSLAFGTALEKAMRGGDIPAAQSEANAAITKVINDLKLADQQH